MVNLDQAKHGFEKITHEFSKRDPGQEGSWTKSIEQQTAKIPSIGFVGLAVGSMILAAGLEIFSKKKEYGNFVGLWAPSFLMIGIYNKLVKLGGSDRMEQSQKKVA